MKPLSANRRIVCDVIHLANRTPLAPVQTVMDVSELKRLRRQAEPRISWQVIMMRAYALVARDFPELRQIYVPFPWARLYEHPQSNCMLTVARRVEGRERLFFVRFCQPENYSLSQLQQTFEHYRRAPLGEIRQLRHQIKFGRLPWPIRKLGWLLMTHLLPASRARQMGTFGMSPSGIRDVNGSFHLGPSTTTLGYDQFCRKGKAYVTLTFDHRIIDGKPAIDALNRLAVVLKNQIVAELQMLIQDNPDTKSENNEIAQSPGSNPPVIRRAAA